MTKTAGIAAVLAVVLIPVIIFIATATAPPVSGRISAVLVIGGSFLAGLLVGSLYFRRRGFALPQSGGRREARPTGQSQQMSIAIAVGGAILIIGALFPTVLGWDTRLVMAMFGAGGLVPMLLPVFRRAIASNRP